MIPKEKRDRDVSDSIAQYLKTGERWRCLANDYFEGEVWLPIEGWGHKYEISNLARIRSILRYANSGKEMILDKPYIFKQFISSTGYLNIQMRDKGKRNKRLKIHRAVASAFNKNPNPKLLKIVNHLDWNKLNNLPHNLQWSTKKEDVNHAFDNGLIGRGEKSYEATITNKTALEIFKDPLRNRDIQKKYGVSAGLITAIKTGKTWSSITGKKYIKNDKRRKIN